MRDDIYDEYDIKESRRLAALRLRNRKSIIYIPTPNVL